MNVQVIKSFGMLCISCCLLLVAGVNAAPTADAGDPQTVDAQSQVSLDGSRSDGPIFGFVWTQTVGPIVILEDANQAMARFLAPDVACSTDLIFKLTVVDDKGAEASDEVTITVLPLLGPVLVELVEDFSVIESNLVELAATTNVTDCNLVSLEWAQLAGSTVSLSPTDELTTSFVAPSSPQPENLMFQLLVANVRGDTGQDSITIKVSPVEEIHLDKLMPGWIHSITSSDNRLYVAYHNALDEVDVSSGTVRPVAGMVYNNGWGIDAPTDVVYHDGRVLVANSGTPAPMIVVDVTDATARAVENVIPQRWADGVDVSGPLVVNSRAIYYQTSNGDVHAQSYPYSAPPELLVTIPDDAYDWSAPLGNEEVLYFYPIQCYQMDIYEVDLDTNSVSNVLSRSAAGDCPFAHAAQNGDFAYFYFNGQIYERDMRARQNRLVVTLDAATIPDLNDLRELAASDEFVFALRHGYNPGSDPVPGEIYKVRIADGSFEIIGGIPHEVRHITVLEGRLYFAEPGWDGYYFSRIYTLDEDNNVILLTEIQDFGGFDITSESGHLVIGGGNEFATYNVMTSEIKRTRLLGNHGRLVAFDEWIYISSGNHGVSRIPVPLNLPETQVLLPGNVSVALYEGTVFLLWRYPQVSVARMEFDGSQYQSLFETQQGELRDIGVYSSGVYFACKDACGQDGWVLAAVSRNGGAPTVVAPLGSDPRVFYAPDEIAYIEDGDVQAIHLATGEQVKLPDVPPNSGMAASDHYLYVASPLMRFRREDWKTLTHMQSVPLPEGLGCDAESLHISRGYFYCWPEENLSPERFFRIAEGEDDRRFGSRRSRLPDRIDPILPCKHESPPAC